jgi:NAD(P)-dependent dehydrogenase (short-subunit alcohol dehydrogenase family)
LVLNVNVKGTIFANQAAFPYFKAGGGSSIVNFGSDAGLRQGVHYAASKGAVHSFTRSLAAA